MVLNEWINGYHDNNFYQWAIILKDAPDEPIGSISVVFKDDRVGKARVGYCIGRTWWHRGIPSEALRAVIVLLFDDVGFSRIEACHSTENPNSGANMRKCGMRFEGALRQSGWCNQGICDASYYGILRDER